MEKMTIHRGLAELKLIDSKIQKQINEIIPTGLTQKDKLVNSFIEKTTFESNAKSSLQSVQDLIKRKTAIKSAIVKVNGETKVKIAGVEMTIADAINKKSTILLEKTLIQTLEAKHRQAKANAEQNNAKVDSNALQLAEAAFGKENVSSKTDDVNSLIKGYKEANTFSIVDPLKVDDLVKDLTEKIELFEVEVDAVLSEINATTFIEL